MAHTVQIQIWEVVVAREAKRRRGGTGKIFCHSLETIRKREELSVVPVHGNFF